MVNFSVSTNIERDVQRDINYIATPNAKEVFDRIINNFRTGHHSFSIIGSYGTGKSSFLWAFEQNLQGRQNYFAQLNGQFHNLKKFAFIKLVGESRSIREALAEKVGLSAYTSDKDILKALDAVYRQAVSEYKCLVLVIDEFGKYLEFAAKHNPEAEFYFIQQLAEYANDPNKSLLFISTLHQNFGAYAKGLTKEQKQEWDKVRGRILDISFDEPVEQLLLLASERIKSYNFEIVDRGNFNELFDLVNNSRLISNANSLDVVLAEKLYPLDPLSANILTQALQKYGQNERSLFTFLSSQERKSLSRFSPTATTTFSVDRVFDYLTQQLAAELEDKDRNPHKQQWRDISLALDKADAYNSEDYDALEKIIKTVGLVNIFSKSSGLLDVEFLAQYCKLAEGIPNAEELIDRLVRQRVIKFFPHRNKIYFLEGTDVDIEQELLDAKSKVDLVTNVVDRLQFYYDLPITLAKAFQYKTGTPRFFKFRITDNLKVVSPEGEIDGYINLIFSEEVKEKELQEKDDQEKGAQLYVLFKDVLAIREILFEIDKLAFIIKKYPEDRIAQRLLLEERQHQQNLLNELVLNKLYSNNDGVAWYYRGEKIEVNSKRTLNQLLTRICEDVYPDTPSFKSELANREYLSTPILTARKALLSDLLINADKEYLGYPADKFPPQKTIYLTLLKETGIHRGEGGECTLAEPSEISFQPLWNACLSFLDNAKIAKKPVSELYNLLQRKPLKIKRGFAEFWVPIFLIVKREDLALFHKERGYIPYIDSDVLDLIHKKPSDYLVKSYQVEGVKLNLLGQYKEITGLSADSPSSNTSFIKIYSSFIRFYRGLPDYTKQTGRLSAKAKGFRDAVAKAEDPAAALFDEIPAGLGFHNLSLEEQPKLSRDLVIHINDAIHELRTAYSNLLERIEKTLLEALGIKHKEFSVYKALIQKRFKMIKANLLLPKQRSFHNRLTSLLDDRDSWLKSVADVAIGKPIERLKDAEEEVLMSGLVDLVKSLEKLLEIHELKESRLDDEILAVELIRTDGSISKEKVIISPTAKEEVDDLKGRLSELLGKNKNVNQAALVKLLEELTK